MCCSSPGSSVVPPPYLLGGAPPAPSPSCTLETFSKCDVLEVAASVLLTISPASVGTAAALVGVHGEWVTGAAEKAGRQVCGSTP